MSIAELLASSISIEWYEAVAISQAICDRLRQSGGDSGSAHIGPSQVFIDESGAVHLAATPARDGRRTHDEVADLLKTMLPADGIPAPLRLALSQTAMSHSVEQWSNTIAYYERPNRAELIRDLYLRAKNTSLRSPSDAPIQIVPVPPRPVSEGTDRSVVKQRTGNVAVAVVTTVGVVAIIAALAVWVVQTRRPRPSASSQPAVVAQEIAAPTLNIGPSLVEALVNRIPIIGARATTVEEVAPPLPGGQWITLPPHRTRNVDALLVAMPVHRSQPFSIGYPPTQLSPAPSSSSIDFPVDLDAAIVYSAADGDVVPPVAVYPQFPSIPSGTDADDVAEFEVVVTQSGQVESVRARRVPASLSEALIVTMSLSAAKTWRFSPGLRNGQPVKYRKVISILNNR